MKKKFYEQQEELKHVGVLGMKWGRRRASSSSGGVRSKLSKNFKKSLNQKYGPNAEARLEVGRQYVKNYLKLAGKAVAVGLVVTAVGRSVAQAYINARAAQRYTELFR